MQWGFRAVVSTTRTNVSFTGHSHRPLSTAFFIVAMRCGRWSGRCAGRGHCWMSFRKWMAESPLAAMTDEERLVADFRATGLTVGPHPMQYRREEMKRMGIYRAADLPQLPNGRRMRIGGCVIARQRPGTAKGMMFMSLEDETGIANAIFCSRLVAKESRAADFRALSDDRGNSAESGQRDPHPGRKSFAAPRYAGRDGIARFSLN